MKTHLILLMMMLSVSTLSAQTHDWWKVNDYAVSYFLPHDWNSDPFGSSSVCDCPGTINDNGVWIGDDYIGMVIYPVTGAERDSSNRQQVWGYGFVAGEEQAEVEYAGITFDATYGSFLGMKGWPRVLQLRSTDKVSGSFMNFIVYFWAEPGVFEQNRETFTAIMETFKRKKLK